MTEFHFDPTDWPGMLKIMDEHGDSKTMFAGKTIIGNTITCSVYNDRIITDVHQDNGWVRTNIYHRDGTIEEIYSR